MFLNNYYKLGNLYKDINIYAVNGSNFFQIP